MHNAMPEKNEENAEKYETAPYNNDNNVFTHKVSSSDSPAIELR